MVRFLHTSDWQLGMTRHFLSEEAQSRFAQDRFDAVRRLLRCAVEEHCAFAVVAGDVFESNHVDRRTVVRGLEALGETALPVYLLPGNHDPLDASSIFGARVFAEHKPANVHVLSDARPIAVADGVELVGAPWTSKRPLEDLVAKHFSGLEPVVRGVRIGVAHGALDSLAAVHDDPARIALATVGRLFDGHRLHYLALGDRHSLTRCDEAGRAWYSGAPEPTDHDEVDPGKALVVDLDEAHVETRPIQVGQWRFVRRAVELYAADDVEALAEWLERVPDKERTVLRFALSGVLRLSLKARLDEIFEDARDLYAAVEVWERQRDLAVVPDDLDFDDLGLEGFAKEAVDALRSTSKRDDEEGFDARTALTLLMRLARREA